MRETGQRKQKQSTLQWQSANKHTPRERRNERQLASLTSRMRLGHASPANEPASKRRTFFPRSRQMRQARTPRIPRIHFDIIVAFVASLPNDAPHNLYYNTSLYLKQNSSTDSRQEDNCKTPIIPPSFLAQLLPPLPALSPSEPSGPADLS